MEAPPFPCAVCACPARCLAAARRSGRLCELASPEHPAHDPAYSKLVCRDDPPAPPGFFRKAASLASAVAAHVAAGLPEVDDAEHARRLAICGGCPEFNADARSCRICGCGMDLKARWKIAHCPIAKW